MTTDTTADMKGGFTEEGLVKISIYNTVCRNTRMNSSSKKCHKCFICKRSGENSYMRNAMHLIVKISTNNQLLFAPGFKDGKGEILVKGNTKDEEKDRDYPNVSERLEQIPRASGHTCKQETL